MLASGDRLPETEAARVTDDPNALSGGEVVICETLDGEVQVDMRLHSETVWLI